jgi:hypothetical protein
MHHKVIHLTLGDYQMNKIVALVLLGIGASVAAMAIATPEIDPASGASALALLAGAVAVIRGRRRK